MINDYIPQAFTLTDNAREKCLSLILIGGEGKVVRVYVEGGGCSGFQYGFKIDTIQEDDTVIEDMMAVDSLSYSYIVGSTVDYKKDIMGSQFQITNPNAVGTCGCGVSFTV
tara:strand:+ start:1866 stop:2198 length:333 start_codon:yes stop_codon:yes gene_type:complete